MRDGVADSRDGRSPARLADPERRPVGAWIDQLDRDLRHLAEAQHGIALPVARADAALIESHPLFECPADPLHDTAFELVDRAVRVDDEAGVGGAPYAQHLYRVSHFNFSDYSGIGGHVLVLREADATPRAGSGRQTGPPAGHLRDMLDDLAGARVGQD